MIFTNFLAIFSSSNLIAGITALMLVLFFIDFFSYFIARQHRDFKSILVSIGVIGTFIGVFIGLFGFDSSDISGSVPKLLDGLKMAFVTSIIGMGLAIFLSIVQKFKGSDNEEDEVIVLHNIHKKLSILDGISDQLYYLIKLGRYPLISFSM